MNTHFKEFPYQEIRKSCGNYFDSWQDAKDHGFNDNQIWSVIHGDENSVCYCPPQHYVNHIGHIATKEIHDSKTYYEESY